MNGAYKSLGLLSIIISWAAIASLLYKFRGHRSMSISKHAAAFKQAYLMMALVETLVLPMLFLFIFKWFSPVFELSSLFMVSTGLIVTGFVIAAWVPDTEGVKATIHEFVAYYAAAIEDLPDS